MTKTEAKREACFIAAMALEQAMSSWDEPQQRYGSDWTKIDAALWELVVELNRRAKGRPRRRVRT